MPSGDCFPAWSPDGSKIAFTSDSDGDYEVYVMNADGSAQTRLTNSPGSGLRTPCGRWTARRLPREPPRGNYEVYVM